MTKHADSMDEYPEEMEELRAKLGDSSFWMDEFSIPQYDVLVRQGIVTQEEADSYRKIREEAGLPMSFDTLRPRPGTAFEWLWRVGGPVVVHDNETVEIEGRKWQARAWAHRSGSLSYHPAKVTENHYLHYELREPYSPAPDNQIAWEATFQLPTGKSIFARVSGKARDFTEAHAAAMAQTFEPVEFAGLTWYTNSTDGWITVNQEGMAVEVKHFAHDGQEEYWRWEVELPEDSLLRRMAELFGQTKFTGTELTREAATAKALGAIAEAKGVAAQLVDADGFEIGRQTGRAELFAQIATLMK